MRDAAKVTDLLEQTGILECDKAGCREEIQTGDNQQAGCQFERIQLGGGHAG